VRRSDDTKDGVSASTSETRLINCALIRGRGIWTCDLVQRGRLGEKVADSAMWSRNFLFAGMLSGAILAWLTLAGIWLALFIAIGGGNPNWTLANAVPE